MATSYASTVIDAPADEVWARVRDFNGLTDWLGGLVASSEIEDGKAGDQVGGVRSFTLVNGVHLRERLQSFSDTDRAYTYSIEKGPYDVDNYRATLRVTPVTDGNRAFVEWWADFDCDRDKQDYWCGFFAGQVFQGGFDALRTQLVG